MSLYEQCQPSILLWLFSAQFMTLEDAVAARALEKTAKQYTHFDWSRVPRADERRLTKKPYEQPHFITTIFRWTLQSQHLWPRSWDINSSEYSYCSALNRQINCIQLKQVTSVCTCCLSANRTQHVTFLVCSFCHHLYGDLLSFL